MVKDLQVSGAAVLDCSLNLPFLPINYFERGAFFLGYLLQPVYAGNIRQIVKLKRGILLDETGELDCMQAGNQKRILP